MDVVTNNDNGEEKIIRMVMDCRIGKSEWVRNPLKLAEVIRAVSSKFGGDYSLRVNYLKGQFGVFKLESNDYTPYTGEHIEIRGVQIPLTPRRSHARNSPLYKDQGFGREREKGVLITIYDAYEIRYEHIPNEDFDNYFEQLDGVEVIKQTQPQTTKGTHTLNGNRYVVVKSNGDDPLKVDVGSAISIRGIKFNIAYTGMQRFCYLCFEKHGNECPVKARWNALKNARDGKTGKRKIYSDSSFRSVNQLALTSDVMCVSGGGLGQICNVIALDEKYDEVIIHGGNNEIATHNTINEFVYSVEKSVEKIQDLAKDREVTLILPCAPVHGPVGVGMAKYMEEKLKAIDTIKTLKLDNIEYDASSHPSEKGTKDMIQQVNEFLGKEVIMEEAMDETTTRKKYAQVQPMYKVGCRGCTVLDFTPTLCDKCCENLSDVHTERLDSIIEEIKNTMYPHLERDEFVFTNDNDMCGMKDLAKRGRENNDDDVNAKSKNPRT